MSKLACIILTKDEEVNLPHCLKCLGWIDELVVCDSGSSDRTLEIAKSFGAKVFVHKPAGEFIPGHQRNWAIDNCVKDAEWILFIDADEIVTEKLKNEIIKKIKFPEGKTGFRLCPKFMFMGRWLKHVTRYPSWHDRLLLRGMVHYDISERDKFDCSPEKLGHIPEPYLHYGFNKGLEEWIAKHNKYSSYHAAKWDEARNKKIDWKEIFRLNNLDLRSRKKALRTMFAKLPGAYAFIQIFYIYIVKRGFLDGYPGFIYSLMLFQYSFMIWFKTIEIKQKKNGMML